jgi:hypothetical protein
VKTLRLIGPNDEQLGALILPGIDAKDLGSTAVMLRAPKNPEVSTSERTVVGLVRVVAQPGGNAEPVARASFSSRVHYLHYVDWMLRGFAIYVVTEGDSRPPTAAESRNVPGLAGASRIFKSRIELIHS